MVGFRSCAADGRSPAACSFGVVLGSIVPPNEKVDAFRLVASAREDSHRIVREAESYANGVVPVARGEAARMGEEALTYNTQQVNQDKTIVGTDPKSVDLQFLKRK
jgi:regulator of protease activity HflC (stomatin/prohibitin superfamily)